MEKLQLEFSGRRGNVRADLGPHARINVENGSVVFSDDALSAMGVKQGSLVNFTAAGGTGYFAEQEQGYTIGENGGFTSKTVADKVAALYKDEAGDNEVVYIGIAEDGLPAETTDGAGNEVEISVHPCTFLSAEPKKQTAPKGKGKSKAKETADAEI